MTRERIKNILLKEWEVLFTDLNSGLMVTLLPLLIVGQAVLYIWLAIHFGGEAILSDSLFQTALEKLRQAFPSVSGLTQEQQLRVLLLSQFNFFLLLIPTMVAMSFAAFSIVEEKLSKSLEALLATPVRTWELLLGKALAGVLPALGITWVCAGVFLLIVTWLGWGGQVRLVVTPSWFLTLFLLTPAVAVLSFMLGVVGSSRAKDARERSEHSPGHYPACIRPHCRPGYRRGVVHSPPDSGAGTRNLPVRCRCPEGCRAAIPKRIHRGRVALDRKHLLRLSLRGQSPKQSQPHTRISLRLLRQARNDTPKWKLS